MNALFDFKPSVKSDGKRVTATSNHKVREELWTLLHLGNNGLGFNVLDIISLDPGKHTEISGKPYPNYSIDAVYDIMLVYLYTAASGLELGNLWQMPLSYVSVNIYESLDQSPGPKISLESLGKIWTNLIVQMAYSALEERLTALGSRIYSHSNEWLVEAQKARRRLQNVDPSKVFYSREVWEYRLEVCDSAIKDIQVTCDEMSDINKELARNQDGVTKLVESFEAAISEDTNLDSLYKLWSELMLVLYNASRAHKSLKEGFSSETARIAWETVKEITPPA